MAYDFKRLGDVDLVDAPAKNANVLIEENGIIKKAPKDAVGGGAGGGCDAMLIFEDLDYSEYGTFATGNYQTLYDKINALQEVKVLVGTKQVVDDFEVKQIFHPVRYSLYEDSISIVIQTGPRSQFCIYVNSDDSVQVEAPLPT